MLFNFQNYKTLCLKLNVSSRNKRIISISSSVGRIQKINLNRDATRESSSEIQSVLASFPYAIVARKGKTQARLPIIRFVLR